MRRTILAAAAASLALAACHKAPPALGADPVDRAATCALVAAAQARSAAVQGPLPIAGQGHILHYPLLAGAASPAFDGAVATAVVQRQQAIGDVALKGKWQVLIPQCAAAFPETATAAPALPPKPLDAQLDCYMLADFMTTALRAQNASAYADPIADYVALKTKLDPKIGVPLGKLPPDALRTRRAEALSAAAKLGSPVDVLKRCAARFG